MRDGFDSMSERLVSYVEAVAFIGLMGFAKLFRRY
jgi:hypothetical protein